MSTEQNKALVRQMVEEVFNRGNMSMADEFLAPDFVEHEELPPGIPPGREAPKVLFTMLRSAFPDFKATIEHLIAEGDEIVLRMTWTGTHEGEFMGIPPTGKRISINVIDILGMAEGKCVEHWGVMDSMAMMQQLGVVPAPGQAG
ncbi:MAG: ester cyclase [Anaerolineae bacterium]|nr:ester cyclase [Anaerolineales bacterium]MCQ3977803.1 ester cyclase [Anaerolineae bacterium]